MSALTLFVLHAPPVHATTTTTAWGSGWLTRGANGSVHSWVSTGSKAKLADLGGGRWKVTFPGITGAFGTPAVTAANDSPGASCAVDNWNALSGDEAIVFHCVRRNGSPVRGGFSVSYTSNVGGSEGWVYANLDEALGGYTPAAYYNSNGGSVAIGRGLVPGRYTVTFDALGILPSRGSYTANAVGATNAHCSVVDSQRYATKTTVFVACAQPDGAPVNVQFVMHMVGRRALLATSIPKAAWAQNRSPGVYGTHTIPAADSYSRNNKPVTVSHPSAGTYVFKFAGLAATSTRMAHASSTYLLDDEGCSATASNASTSAIVTVQCRDHFGQPADVPVDVQYEGV